MICTASSAQKYTVVSTAADGQKPSFIGAGYFIRYLVLGGIVAFFHVFGILPIGAILVGMAGFGFAILFVADGLRAPAAAGRKALIVRINSPGGGVTAPPATGLGVGDEPLGELAQEADHLGGLGVDVVGKITDEHVLHAFSMQVSRGVGK